MSDDLSHKSQPLPSPQEGSFRDYEPHSVSASPSSVGQCDDVHDSGCSLGEGSELIEGLEKKIDKLNDLYEEQCRLLEEIKQEMRCSREDPQRGPLVMELMFRALLLNQVPEEEEETGEVKEDNVRARSLLEALQGRRGCNLDREIAQALVDFLQSEELRCSVSMAAMEAARQAVRQALHEPVPRAYRATLERCHRTLLRHVTRVLEDAFLQLQQHTALYWPWLQRRSLGLQRALHRHHRQLQHHGARAAHTLQRILEKELQQWRERALETVFSREDGDGDDDDEEEEEVEEPAEDPASPPQPADPGVSIIDQMMMAAEINKLIQDGDVNSAFEKALSASNLSLVVGACRQVPPALLLHGQRVPGPVLLSLLQQLATDMVHDTPLKCRYLEEALISLSSSPPPHRAHLSLVIGDMRRHLTDFLTKYPGHVASRRVTLIVMAADNLLK